MKRLTHIDKKGRAAMVDIGDKKPEQRYARASGHISLSGETLRLIGKDGIKKGDVLTVAQIAGIVAAKKTPELIPLCHNILLDNIKVELKTGESGITAESEVKCTGKTGAEMEALTSVSVALLTIYDMCKAVDRNMVIGDLMLLQKTKK
ncbi:MAG TPA: cyclic pyranopterin monophosphate synthase MoaC [Bacteroidales bacterium]|nr:cyclic pyranopterin monophosphate synthase MoaC [Bacteroidales bacterium]